MMQDSEISMSMSYIQQKIIATSSEMKSFERSYLNKFVDNESVDFYFILNTCQYCEDSHKCNTKCICNVKQLIKTFINVM